MQIDIYCKGTVRLDLYENEFALELCKIEFEVDFASDFEKYFRTRFLKLMKLDVAFNF